jgi:hypothetical protein
MIPEGEIAISIKLNPIFNSIIGACQGKSTLKNRLGL